MPTTRDEIDQFHQFAVDQLSQANESWELDDLLLFWYESRQRDEVNSVIRQGLRDIDNGLGKPASTVAAALNHKYGLNGE